MKRIMWLLFFAFLIYLGVKFGMPYYRYLAFKSDTKEIARVSVQQGEEEIRKSVFERAQELKIPVQEKDIEISMTPLGVRIKTSWFEVVDILGMYRKTLMFSVDSGE